jgi:hypothetical protein
LTLTLVVVPLLEAELPHVLDGPGGSELGRGLKSQVEMLPLPVPGTTSTDVPNSGEDATSIRVIALEHNWHLMVIGPRRF